MVRELSHYIDGQRVDGVSGRFGDVYDPCTGEVQARLPLASASLCVCRKILWRRMKGRGSPKLTEAITGAGPSSGSSSLCMPMLSRPFR